MLDTSRNILDAIYEAAFIIDKWPAALEALAQATGGIAGQIVAMDMASKPRFLATDLSRQSLTQFFEDPRWPNAGRTNAMMAARPFGFVTDIEFFGDTQRAEDPLTNYFRQANLGGYAGTVVPMPTGERAAISILRRLQDGYPSEDQLGVLDAHRPHLARASLMVARMKMQQARNMVSALSALGIAAGVLATNLRLIACNEIFQGLQSTIATTAFDRVILRDAEANTRFVAAFEAIRVGAIGHIQSIPCRRRDDVPPSVIHLVPILGAAADIFSGGYVLAAVTPVVQDLRTPTASMLNALFDLTPAEARLTVALTAGKSLKEAAGEIGITFGTARNYLERVFRKTGAKQQSGLVALLKTT